MPFKTYAPLLCHRCLPDSLGQLIPPKTTEKYDDVFKEVLPGRLPSPEVLTSVAGMLAPYLTSYQGIIYSKNISETALYFPIFDLLRSISPHIDGAVSVRPLSGEALKDTAEEEERGKQEEEEKEEEEEEEEQFTWNDVRVAIEQRLKGEGLGGSGVVEFVIRRTHELSEKDHIDVVSGLIEAKTSIQNDQGLPYQLFAEIAVAHELKLREKRRRGMKKLPSGLDITWGAYTDFQSWRFIWMRGDDQHIFRTERYVLELGPPQGPEMPRPGQDAMQVLSLLIGFMSAGTPHVAVESLEYSKVVAERKQRLLLELEKGRLLDKTREQLAKTQEELERERKESQEKEKRLIEKEKRLIEESQEKEKKLEESQEKEKRLIEESQEKEKIINDLKEQLLRVGRDCS